MVTAKWFQSQVTKEFYHRKKTIWWPLGGFDCEEEKNVIKQKNHLWPSIGFKNKTFVSHKNITWQPLGGFSRKEKNSAWWANRLNGALSRKNINKDIAIFKMGEK